MFPVALTAERNETAQRLFGRAGFRRTMIELTRELDERSVSWSGGWVESCGGERATIHNVLSIIPHQALDP
jgi:hypothetical protein